VSPETLKKMSLAQTSKVVSVEARENMRAAAFRAATPERRQMLAEVVSRRSEDWKIWFAQNQKGVPKSLDHRLKIAAAKLGVPRSEETKRKLSEANTGKGLYKSLADIDQAILCYFKSTGRRPVAHSSLDWGKACGWLRAHQDTTLAKRCDALGLPRRATKRVVPEGI
jgi:hypothetical protein